MEFNKEKLTSYIKLMRPHHYLKNALIFLPLIFSKGFTNINLLLITIIGTIAFSLMSSVVYIINDIVDAPKDRMHETKKNRPIASGKISVKKAIILAIILLLITIILNIYIASKAIANKYYLYFIVFYGYLVMNILYSVKLKNVPILDITILAIGFVLRVIYGALIIGVEISNWLYLTVLSFSFYMGLGKRRNEFKKNGSKSRKVLEQYSETFLDNNMYVCMTIGIVFYSLWCIDVQNILKSFINVIYTIPLVIIICMKYSLNVEGDSSGDPADVILGDKVLLTLALVYAIIMFMIIYL